MPEIGKWSLYDVDDLIQAWECGWREFAQLGENLCLPRSSAFARLCPPMDVSDRIVDGFCEIYSDMLRSHSIHPLWDGQIFLALAATPKNQSFPKRPDSSRPFPRDFEFMRYNPWDGKEARTRKAELARRKVVGRVTSAFANSTTVEEAFSKIGTIKQRKEFMEYCGQFKVQKEMAAEIRGHWAKAMKWLDYGLTDETACEGAYWSCVWCYLESDVEVMLEIKNRIDGDVPLTDDQYNLLNKHMSSGYPQGYRVRHWSDRGETYELVLEQVSVKVEETELAITATQVLAQPAFSLAGDLQRSWSKPRFVRKCRAPSCGKAFYTGRKNATACPGSQGDKKNKCGLEWIRYKNFLRKTGKRPETDWDNKQLQEEFISYDKS